MAMKLHTGDNVIMLSGKDRGKSGKILKVIPSDEKLLVEGLNMVKRNIKAKRQGQKGQVIAKERLVSIASVALICKSCGKPTRVGYELRAGKDNTTTKIRICKKCKAEV